MFTTTPPPYTIGDTLTYETHGQSRTGRVIGKYDDIKNGRAGFDLDNGTWGYDSQIVEVVPMDREEAYG